MRRTTYVLLTMLLVISAGYLVGFRDGADDGAQSAQAAPPDILFGCVHYWNSTIKCPELPNPQERYLSFDSVRAIRVGLVDTEGRFHAWDDFIIDRTDSLGLVDAVFFSRDAVWNVWLPYMRRIRTAEHARAFWEDSVPRRQN